jgi:hypothetical protein
MPDCSNLTVRVSTGVPDSAPESLIAVLRTQADVTQDVQRLGAQEWLAFTAAIKAAGAPAGAVTSVVVTSDCDSGLAGGDRIISMAPKVRLDRPLETPLDLETCTDEEIKGWLLPR